MKKQNEFNFTKWFTIIFFGSIILTILVSKTLIHPSGSDNLKNTNSYAPSSISSQSTSSEPKKTNPCYGDENCIGKVRSNFESTGKQILGEQYLGDGKFGISFLDANRGESYNADVSTDCNCVITNVNVSLMR